MTHHVNRQSGFTLVELMFALAFTAFVLIFSVTTIIRVMSTYNKGIAVKEINQTARSATEDMARIVSTVGPDNIIVVAAANRVCFGGVSYVWNVGSAATNRFTDGSTVTFVRVNDPSNALCDNSSGSYPNLNLNQSTKLLSNNVWVQRVTVTPQVSNNLVDLTIQLSTTEDAANPSLQTDIVQGVKCRAGPAGEFCAVATFSTTVATRGGQ